MALVLKDRVLETCTSPGTGTITLLGAVTGYQAFSTVGNGNTCYYAIADQNGANWEVGIGTYSSGTLARTTVLSSSNAGSLTNFSTGSQNVFLTYPSERSVNLSSAALTSGRVAYATTDGLLTDSATLTYNGTTLTATTGANFATTSGSVGIGNSSPQALLHVGSVVEAPGFGITTQMLYVNGTSQPEVLVRETTNDVVVSMYADSTSGSIRTATNHPLVFFTNNTDRMRITSAGNVGIGTSSPSTMLHLQRNTTSGTASVYPNIRIDNPNGAGYTGLYFYQDATQKAGFEVSNASGDLQFLTSSERMRITSAGLVGIGTSSPAYKLVVIDTANEKQQITFSNNATYFGSISHNAGTGLNEYRTESGGGHGWFIGTSTTTANMTLDSSGNLGLGVTPSANQYGKNLQINQTILNDDNIDSNHLAKNAYYNSGWKYYSTGYASKYTQSLSIHSWSIAASGTAGNAITFTQAMTLDASGFLGIGQTSPICLIDVYGGGAYTYARFYRSDEAGYGGRVGTGNTLHSLGAVRSLGLDGFSQISFGIAGVQVAQINSSGYLLVNSTSQVLSYHHNIRGGTNNGLGMMTLQSAYDTNISHSFGPNSNGAFVIYRTPDNVGVYLGWGNTSWTANSDERNKDIIEPILDAVNKVSSLRAVIGKYKTDNEGTRRSFLIAQDVQKVLPEAVDATNPDNLGVQYTEVIPLLVAAIKEQQALIESLTTTVNSQAQLISSIQEKLGS